MKPESLKLCKEVHERIKARVDSAQSGKRGTARVELHVSVQDVRILVELAGGYLRAIENQLDAGQLGE